MNYSFTCLVKSKPVKTGGQPCSNTSPYGECSLAETIQLYEDIWQNNVFRKKFLPLSNLKGGILVEIS